MREILFRGKNFDNGVWVQGYYVRLNGNKHFIYTGQSDVDCGNYYPDYYPVAAKTVGQFTGLKDMSNRKIFEGDIIVNSEYTGVVKYSEEDAMYTVDLNGIKYDFSWIEAGMCEVIGNIHDNPELLGGE